MLLSLYILICVCIANISDKTICLEFGGPAVLGGGMSRLLVRPSNGRGGA